MDYEFKLYTFFLSLEFSWSFKIIEHRRNY